VGKLVDRFGLGPVLGRRIATYSGGTRRRLDLAAALLHQPKVLSLDEPTTGLDPQSRRALWEQVRELRDDGSAILLTTQYLEEAAQLADHIAVLQAGRLVAQDTPAGLRRRHGGLRLRLHIDDQGPSPTWAGNGHAPDRHGWITRPVASAGQARILLDELVRADAPIAEFPPGRAHAGGRLPGAHRLPAPHQPAGGPGRRPYLEEPSMPQIASLARQTRLVFGRSLRAGLREPALAFVFPVAFPLLIIGLFSQVYARVADLPGFLDRLRLLAVHPAAFVLGRLGFDVARVTVAGLGVLAVAVNPYSHVVDSVRAAMAGTLDAGQLAAGLVAVTGVVVLTQVAAARRFAGLVHHD
jgi:hypothetical protein